MKKRFMFYSDALNGRIISASGHKLTLLLKEDMGLKDDRLLMELILGYNREH